jgi:hypothetical protein
VDYAVVTFAGTLTGEEAKGFFGYLGTIDPALWSGTFAGFTQIDFRNSSMLAATSTISSSARDSDLFGGGMSDTSGLPCLRLQRGGRRAELGA